MIKILILLVVLIISIAPAYAVNWQCTDLNYEMAGNYTVWQNVNFSYVGAVESITYPSYYIDTKYLVNPPNLNYISNYSGGTWSKINYPNFTIQTNFLFSSPDAVDVTYCVDSDFSNTPAPTPTPTAPVIPTVTATSEIPNGNSVTGNDSFCLDGTCSDYPDRYNEGDYETLGDNSLPSDSVGFKQVLEDNGYASNVKGGLAFLQDTMILYLFGGIVIFTSKLLGGFD